MHEPLACGAFPAQHSRLHKDPAVTAASGTMPDKKAASSTPVIMALAMQRILNRLE
jgi:hypothetical protein